MHPLSPNKQPKKNVDVTKEEAVQRRLVNKIPITKDAPSTK